MKSPNKKNNNSKVTAFYDKKMKLMEIVPIGIFLIMFFIALFSYSLLPKSIPIHWNASGEVDGFSDKGFVFLIPAIYLILYILTFILPAMDTYSTNIKSFYKYYYLMKVGMGVFFLALFILTLLPNFNYTFNLSKIVLILVSLLFMLLGYIMRHTKRNYFLGIRTAWTLSSEEVWTKTHNIGGILFIIFGAFITLISFFVNPEITYAIFISGIIVLSIYIIFYSYFTYKKIYKNKNSGK